MNDLVTLAQAGPVAILLVGIFLLFRAFVRGDIVPGWIYKAMEARAEKSETQADRTADALLMQAQSALKVAADGHADAGPPDHA